MGYLKNFFAGLALSLLVLGAGGYWYLNSHETVKPKEVIDIEKKVADRTGTINGIEFDIKLDATPEMAAILKRYPENSVLLFARQIKNGVAIERTAVNTVANPKFPSRVNLHWTAEAVASHLKSNQLGTFQILVSVCLNQVGQSCNKFSPPSVFGVSIVTPKLEGGLKTRPGEFVISIDAGNLILNRSVLLPDLEACAKSGSTVSGQLAATPDFIAKIGAGTRALIVGVPFPGLSSKLPFEGIDNRPLSRAEAETALARGVAITAVNLSASPAPFSIHLPKGQELTPLNYFAVTCKRQEADMDCLTRFTAHSNEYALSYPNAGVYRLVAKGYANPVCGDKTVLYLQDFKKPAGSATIEAYRAATTPELVDGIFY